MKIIIYVRIEDLENLHRVIKGFQVPDKSIRWAIKRPKIYEYAMVQLTYDDYITLIDRND